MSAAATAARRAISRLVRLETSAKAPDARRIIRDVRMNLTTTVERADDATIHAETAEAMRIAGMWKGY